MIDEKKGGYFDDAEAVATRYVDPSISAPQPVHTEDPEAEAFIQWGLDRYLPISDEGRKLFGSFARTENPLLRAHAQQSVRGADDDIPRDASFDFEKTIRDDGITAPDDIKFLRGARSLPDYENLKLDLDSYKADRDRLGKFGFGANLFAGLVTAPLDPINYIPLPPLLTGGSKALRLARFTGASGALATGREAILQEQQPHRTTVEGVANIAGETLLAGILGGAIVAIPTGRRSGAYEDLQEAVYNEATELSTDTTIPMRERAQPDPIGKHEDSISGEPLTRDFTEHFEDGAKVVDENDVELPKPTSAEEFDAKAIDPYVNGDDIWIDESFLSLAEIKKDDYYNAGILEQMAYYYAGAPDLNRRPNYREAIQIAVNNFANFGEPTPEVKAWRIEKFQDYMRSFNNLHNGRAINLREAREGIAPPDDFNYRIIARTHREISNELMLYIRKNNNAMELYKGYVESAYTDVTWQELLPVTDDITRNVQEHPKFDAISKREVMQEALADGLITFNDLGDPAKIQELYEVALAQVRQGKPEPVVARPIEEVVAEIEAKHGEGLKDVDIDVDPAKRIIRIGWKC